MKSICFMKIGESMNKLIRPLLLSVIGISAININGFACQAMENYWKREIQKGTVDTLVIGGLRETPANMKPHWIMSGENCLVVNTDPTCEPDIQANGFDVTSLNAKLNFTLSDRSSYGFVMVKYEHVGWGFDPSKHQAAFEKLCSLLKLGGTFEYSSSWVYFTYNINKSGSNVRYENNTLPKLLGFQVSSEGGHGLDQEIQAHFSVLTTPFFVDYQGVHSKYFLPDSKLTQYVQSFIDLNLKNIQVMVDMFHNAYSFTIRGTV